MIAEVVQTLLRDCGWGDGNERSLERAGLVPFSNLSDEWADRDLRLLLRNGSRVDRIELVLNGAVQSPLLDIVDT